MSISGHGNDHRLGANEAPPSIISVFLGDELEQLYKLILEGKDIETILSKSVDLKTGSLVQLLKHNSDRNRTSPFAFTGDKFEFRAVGSSQSISFPMTFLNAAVTDIFKEANSFIENKLKDNDNIDEVLKELIKKLLTESQSVIFNGNGYSNDWVKEAEKRGLPNLKTSSDTIRVLKDKKEMKHLIDLGVMSELELNARYNVMIEKYVISRSIEIKILIELIYQNVLPSAIEYKSMLINVIESQKRISMESSVEKELCNKVQNGIEKLFNLTNQLQTKFDNLDKDHQKAATQITSDLLFIMDEISKASNSLEKIVPDDLWNLPKYRDMLFNY